MVKRNSTIEVGRLVQINYGDLAGKVAVVIDIVDQNRALVDGPFKITGVKRQTIPFKRLSLTHVKVNVDNQVGEKGLIAALTSAQGDAPSALDQWKKTSWAKKIAQKQVQAGLNDFQRFQAARLKAQRNFLINQEVAKLRAGQ